MSLDRSVAALNVGVPQPLDEEGECLHNWLFGDGTTAPTEADREVIQEMFAQAGAFVMGRHTFDFGEGRWGDDGAVRSHRTGAAAIGEDSCDRVTLATHLVFRVNNQAGEGFCRPGSDHVFMRRNSYGNQIHY